MSIAEYVDRSADSVEQLSTHLRQRNVDKLIRDTESGARRQPAFFSTGAFVLGLVAAGFIKSSRREPRRLPDTTSRKALNNRDRPSFQS